MVEIIPAILANDPQDLREKIEVAGQVVVRVQIDIIDGEFADNKTIDPTILTNLETNLNYDFHLMVKEPVNWVEKCINAGGDRIIGQIEMMNDQFEFINKIQEKGMLAGLAIDIDTPVSQIEPSALSAVDLVLVLSVKAGFGGQEFDKKAIEKIEELVRIRERENFGFRIGDDGGVTMEEMPDLSQAKVDEVVIGSRIFKGDIGKNINAYLKE